MKKIAKILLVGVFTLVCVACDKHDKLDDLVFVGEMAPQVHWTIPSTVATAGSGVAFDVQYYTTGESPISHLEVWYSINETETKTVSAPWVVSKPYTVASETSMLRRISQKISEYEHSDEYWNGEERAYKFTSTFPTSNTLGRVSWGSKDYSDDKVDANFGANFRQHFKDSLYNYLMDSANHRAAFRDFQTLLANDSINKANCFTPYATKSWDENSQDYYDHFVGNKVPYALDSLYQAMSFEDIITNSAGDLIINYGRNYSLDAQLRCLDEAGTAGLTSITTINLN